MKLLLLYYIIYIYISAPPILEYQGRNVMDTVNVMGLRVD